MPDVDICVNIEVYCSKCGAGLCGQTRIVNDRHGNTTGFNIEPCKHCLEQSFDEGFDRGKEEQS